MYKLCKTEQSAKRQRELEQHLLAAMSSHAYEEISVSDLCNWAQIPRKAFYRYFSSKDGALHALLDHTLMEFEGYSFLQRPGEVPIDRKDVERFFSFWQKRKQLLDAVQRSGLAAVLVERCVSHVLSDMGEADRFQSRIEKTARGYSVIFCVSGIMALVLRWHREGYQMSAQEMSRISMNIMNKPIILDSAQ